MSGKRVRHGVAHYIKLGLSGGLLALVALLAAILIVIPLASGATPLTILSSSMEPHLPPGTLIVVKPKLVEDIRIGDVVTYQIYSGDPTLVTHRVIARNSSSDGNFSLTVQGDNNDVPDATPISTDQVKGVLWYSVPWVGHISVALNGSIRGWLIPVIAIALLSYAGFMLVSGFMRPMGQRRRPTSRRSSAQQPHGRRRRQNRVGYRLARQNGLTRRQLHRHLAQV